MRIRRWIAENVFLKSKHRFCEYLLECLSTEVRKALEKGGKGVEEGGIWRERGKGGKGVEEGGKEEGKGREMGGGGRGEGVEEGKGLRREGKSEQGGAGRERGGGGGTEDEGKDSP